MPRNWVRDREWQRQPHVKDGPPPSLWWYARPDHRRVVDAYVQQCKRGRALPDDFKEDLVMWLDDLSRIQNKKAWGQPRTYRYWSVPAYARAHNMEPPALMKRLREMEKFAVQLFTDSVPTSRKPRPQLTDDEKQKIRQRYLAGEDCKKLAEEFRLTLSHVGQLCRKEREARDKERLSKMDARHPVPTGTPATGGDPVEPF